MATSGLPIRALCLLALVLVLLGHEVLAALVCGPPLLVLVVLDQRRFTAAFHSATAGLRARAPQLTFAERKAELDALTARYGGKWTPEVRRTARELGVEVAKIDAGRMFATSNERNKRALLILVGFIGVLMLLALVLNAID